MKYRSAPHNNRDAIEPAIVAALAKIGVEWSECGPLDGWVKVLRVPVKGVDGRWTRGDVYLTSHLMTKGIHVPVELKDPSKRNSNANRKFTEQQRHFMAYCDRNNLPYFIWHSVEECLRDMT